MPQDLDFDIIGGFKKQEFVEFDPQETVNMFEVNDPQGKKGKALFPTPGLNLENGTVFDVTGGGRALYFFNDRMYAVVSNNFYQIDSSLNYSVIGTLNTTTGYVGFANNETQLVLVDGIDGWIFDSSVPSFTKITDLDFPNNPTDVIVLSNRFIVSDADSKVLKFSDPGDPFSWDPLNFFSMSSYPDEVIALETLNGQIYIMGKRSTEVWFDAGAPSLPFRRQNPTYEFGSTSSGSVVSAFGILVWLSRTNQGIGSIVATTGGRPTAISNQALDTELGTYEDVNDASSYIYKNELGHIMYVINFTNDNASWMYDFHTQQWSKLEYKANDRHLGQDHTYFNNKHYVIDYSGPNLYELSNAYSTDNGVSIRRSRTTTILTVPTYNYIIVNKMTIDMKHGTGIEHGLDENPKVFLSISYDGGISYGNSLSTNIGKIGRRTFKSSFYRLGRSDSFVFKIEHYNDVPFVLLGGFVNAEIQPQGD